MAKGFTWISGIPGVIAGMNLPVQQAVNETALAIQKKAKQNATRLFYQKTTAGGRPRAKRSPTGLLRRSMSVILAKGTSTTARFEVRAPYALYLEYGTRKMGPYPFLGPAIESERANHMMRIRKAL